MSSSKKRKTPSTNTATIPSKSSHAATTAPPRERWRCDVCLVAIFDSYDEAVIHENKCREKLMNDNVVDDNMKQTSDNCDNNKTRASSIDLLSAKIAAKDNNGKGTVRHGESNIIVAGDCSKSTADSIIKEKKIQHTSKKVKPNPNNTADKEVKEASTSSTATTQKPTTTTNNKRKTNWRCDVCLEAVFEDYNDAVAHEKQCTGGSKKNKKAKNSTEKQQQEEDVIVEQGKFVHVKEHHIGNGAYIGGGTAQVTKVNVVQLGSTAVSGCKKTYDVAYILGGNEEGVESCYITLAKGSPQKKEKDKTMPTSSPPKKKQTPPKTNPSHILVKPVASRSPGIKLLSSTKTPEKKSNGDDTTNNDSFEHSPTSPFEVRLVDLYCKPSRSYLCLKRRYLLQDKDYCSVCLSILSISRLGYRW